MGVLGFLIDVIERTPTMSQSELSEWLKLAKTLINGKYLQPIFTEVAKAHIGRLENIHKRTLEPATLELIDKLKTIESHPKSGLRLAEEVLTPVGYKMFLDLLSLELKCKLENTSLKQVLMS